VVSVAVGTWCVDADAEGDGGFAAEGVLSLGEEAEEGDEFGV